MADKTQNQGETRSFARLKIRSQIRNLVDEDGGESILRRQLGSFEEARRLRACAGELGLDSSDDIPQKEDQVVVVLVQRQPDSRMRALRVREPLGHEGGLADSRAARYDEDLVGHDPAYGLFLGGRKLLLLYPEQSFVHKVYISFNCFNTT